MNAVEHQLLITSIAFWLSILICVSLACLAFATESSKKKAAVMLCGLAALEILACPLGATAFWLSQKASCEVVAQGGTLACSVGLSAVVAAGGILIVLPFIGVAFFIWARRV